MIKAIFNLLTSDSILTNLVGYTPRNQRIREFIPKNRTDYPYIIFAVYPYLAGDATTQYRVDVTILTKDVMLIESISSRVITLLNFNKHGFKLDDTLIYTSKHIGGQGIGYDPNQELFEQILSFNVKGN